MKELLITIISILGTLSGVLGGAIIGYKLENKREFEKNLRNEQETLNRVEHSLYCYVNTEKPDNVMKDDLVRSIAIIHSKLGKSFKALSSEKKVDNFLEKYLEDDNRELVTNLYNEYKGYLKDRKISYLCIEKKYSSVESFKECMKN